MSTDYSRALGARLRAIRNQQGLSLQGVEDKSHGRWKAVVVGSYERGDRAVTVQRLSELAVFYGVPVSELLPDPRPSSAVTTSTKIVLNLESLGSLPADEAGPLARYASTIQAQRHDYNGKVLSIRTEDLKSLAIIYDMSPDELTTRLIEWGVLSPAWRPRQHGRRRRRRRRGRPALGAPPLPAMNCVICGPPGDTAARSRTPGALSAVRGPRGGLRPGVCGPPRVGTCAGIAACAKVLGPGDLPGTRRVHAGRTAGRGVQDLPSARTATAEGPRRLDLVVEAAVCTASSGPNGSGKTTSIRVLLGLVRPDAAARSGCSTHRCPRACPV